MEVDGEVKEELSMCVEAVFRGGGGSERDKKNLRKEWKENGVNSRMRKLGE